MKLRRNDEMELPFYATSDRQKSFSLLRVEKFNFCIFVSFFFINFISQKISSQEQKV